MNKFYNFVNKSDVCEVYLYGDVGTWDDVNVADFKAQLEGVDSEKPLNIHISSYGGEVNEGLAISSIIRKHEGKTKAIIDSWACSIASIIACSCDEVEMYNSSMLMIHNALCCAFGNAKELREQADVLDKISNSLKTVYLEKAHGKLDLDKVTELMDAESWLSAEECLEIGLCDNIIEVGNKMVAKFNDENILNKYKNVPQSIVDSINQAKQIEIENKINEELIDLCLELGL